MVAVAVVEVEVGLVVVLQQLVVVDISVELVVEELEELGEVGLVHSLEAEVEVEVVPTLAPQASISSAATIPRANAPE